MEIATTTVEPHQVHASVFGEMQQLIFMRVSKRLDIVTRLMARLIVRSCGINMMMFVPSISSLLAR